MVASAAPSAREARNCYGTAAIAELLPEPLVDGNQGRGCDTAIRW